MARFKVSDIQPNPWRNLARYPVRRDKVVALRESLRETGWWRNVVARIGPDGRPQIAYGHHRLIALLEEFGPGREVELIIEDLDDETMIKIMARENLDEFGTSAQVQQETVRTVVEAFAAGAIELYPTRIIIDAPYAAMPIAERAAAWLAAAPLAPTTKKNYRLSLEHVVKAGLLTGVSTDSLAAAAALRALLHTIKNDSSLTHAKHISAVITGALDASLAPGSPARRTAEYYGGRSRIAPSFILQPITENMDLTHAYSVNDIAAFTGGNGSSPSRVRHALNVLELIEQELLSEEDFAAVSNHAAGKIAAEVRALLRDRAALAALARTPEIRNQVLETARTDATDLARHIITDISTGQRGSADGAIRESARQSGVLLPTRQRRAPDINIYAATLARQLDRLLLPGNRTIHDLELFIKHRDRLNPAARHQVTEVLHDLARRATRYAHLLNEEGGNALPKGSE